MIHSLHFCILGLFTDTAKCYRYSEDARKQRKVPCTQQPQGLWLQEGGLWPKAGPRRPLWVPGCQGQLRSWWAGSAGVREHGEVPARGSPSSPSPLGAQGTGAVKVGAHLVLFGEAWGGMGTERSWTPWELAHTWGGCSYSRTFCNKCHPYFSVAFSSSIYPPSLDGKVWGGSVGETWM